MVLIIIIAVATSGGSDDSSPSGSQNGSAQNAPANGGGEQAAGLNTPVRDGKFEFVVTGVEKGSPASVTTRISPSRRKGSSWSSR